MFSATLAEEMRTVCKKFMQDPMEIYVDDSKLTLHGLQQHYVKLKDAEKNRKLFELLDVLEFNQVFKKIDTPPLYKQYVFMVSQLPSLGVFTNFGKLY